MDILRVAVFPDGITNGLQFIGLPDDSIIKYIKCNQYLDFPFTIKINGIPVEISKFINKCYIEASGDVVIGINSEQVDVYLEIIYFFPG